MTLDSATMQGSSAAQPAIEQRLRTQGNVPHRSRFARYFGFSPLGADSKSWYLGAKGEIVVGSILATLPPDWTVLHAVPSGSTNTEIDHLVVGPGGIFTITTKHHPRHDIRVGRDTLQIDGGAVPYLRTAESAAERVTNLVRERMPLVAPVQPVIVFVDPRLLTVEQRPEQVKVLNAEDLRAWLVRLHPVLSAGEVQEVADILDSPHVWRALPDATSDATSDATPGDLSRRFAATGTRARSAGIRRMSWGLFAAAGTIAAGYVVFQFIEAALATA